MTRVAVGCSDYPSLQARIADYARDGEVRFTTRFRPKRADELLGGKLHFIVKHMLVGRVEILRFDDRADGRVDIRGGAIWPPQTRHRRSTTTAPTVTCRPNFIANSPSSA